MITHRGKGTPNTIKPKEIWEKTDKSIPYLRWYNIVRTVCKYLRRIAADGIVIRLPKFGSIKYFVVKNEIKQRKRIDGSTYFVDHRHKNFETGEKYNGFSLFLAFYNRYDKRMTDAYFSPQKNLVREIKNNCFDCNYKITDNVQYKC